MSIKVKQEMTVNTDKGVMRVCVVDITPECAKTIMQYNTNNRRIKKERVLKYAADIKNGRWKNNGVPIVIGDDWVLKDGQHRLLAVIKSETTLYNALIVFVPEENANNYDLNAVRTIKDILKLDGVDSAIMSNNSIAAAIGFGIKTATMQNWQGNVISKSAITKNMVIDEMNKHIDAVKFVYPFFASNKGAKIKKAALIAAVINAYLSGYSETTLKDFCTVLTSGITTSELDIQIIKLRDYANNMKGRGVKDDTELYYRTQNCLHNYERKISKKILTSSSTEYYKYPLIEANQLKFEENSNEEFSSDIKELEK